MPKLHEDLRVRIQVTKVYELTPPEDCADPVEWANSLQSTKIADDGDLIDVTVDHAQLFMNEEPVDDIVLADEEAEDEDEET